MVETFRVAMTASLLLPGPAPVPRKPQRCCEIPATRLAVSGSLRPKLGLLLLAAVLLLSLVFLLVPLLSLPHPDQAPRPLPLAAALLRPGPVMLAPSLLLASTAQHSPTSCQLYTNTSSVTTALSLVSRETVGERCPGVTVLHNSLSSPADRVVISRFLKERGVEAELGEGLSRVVSLDTAVRLPVMNSPVLRPLLAGPAGLVAVRLDLPAGLQVSLFLPQPGAELPLLTWDLVEQLDKAASAPTSLLLPTRLLTTTTALGGLLPSNTAAFQHASLLFSLASRETGHGNKRVDGTGPAGGEKHISPAPTSLVFNRTFGIVLRPAQSDLVIFMGKISP